MRYDSIQLLRAIAAMSVVLLHGQFAVHQPPAFRIPFFSDFGWIGVRLFFVISGFIIAERIERERSLGSYLVKRYLRVFPLYFVVTSIAIALSAYFGELLFVVTRTDSGLPFDPAPVWYIINSLLIIPQDEWPLFMVGWSLEYEVVFYASFGLAYFTLGRRGALVAVTLASAIGLFFPSETRPLLDSFFVYFLFGFAASEAHRMQARYSPLVPALLCIVFTVLSGLQLYRLIHIPGPSFVLMSGMACASLIVWWANLERRQALFQVPTPLVRLGDMSFSLYLFHWLVIALFGFATRDTDFSPVAAETLRGFAVACSIALSYVGWKYVELPINAIVKKRSAPVARLSLET